MNLLSSFGQKAAPMFRDLSLCEHNPRVVHKSVPIIFSPTVHKIMKVLGVLKSNGCEHRVKKSIPMSICIIGIKPLADVCHWRYDGLALQREPLPQLCDHAVLILVWAASEHDGGTQRRARLVLTQMSREYCFHWRHGIHDGVFVVFFLEQTQWQGGSGGSLEVNEGNL